MPFFLKHRQQQLRELMDDPDCDVNLLEQTYHDFKSLNRFLSKWYRIYKKDFLPYLRKNNGMATVLDIGFGGGDIPLFLYKKALQDGFQLHITAIEMDDRSLNYISKINTPDQVAFKKASLSDLLNQEESYDFIISNHLIHHLDDPELNTICTQSQQLVSHKIIFNDIERNDLGYLLFTMLTIFLYRNSFVPIDGKISIKRSFTYHELQEKAPRNWYVEKLFPFRLMLCYDVGSNK